MPYLPARHRLQLTRTCGLVLNSEFVAASAGVGHPVLLPPVVAFIGVPTGLRLSDVVAALRDGPRRINLLDVSALGPDDVDEIPTALNSVGALAVPMWMSDGDAESLRAAIAARTVIREQPVLAALPTMPESDPAALRTLVADAVERHPTLGTPETAGAAINLARTFLDVGRPSEALAILAPWLAAEDGDAYATAITATMKLDEPLAALAACEQAIASGTDLAWVLTTRAEVLRMTRHPAAAILALDEAMAVNWHSQFPLAVLTSAYTDCRQLDAAEAALAMLADVDPTGRDTLFLRAHIRHVANEERGTSGPAHRVRARAEQVLWRDLLASYPTDAAGLRRLAEAERAGNPWRSRWAATYLRAVDENPSAAEGRTLARLVREHPMQIALYVAAIIGMSWFFLAYAGLVAPTPVGWPIAAGGIAGAGAFGFLRSRIPKRARRAARQLVRSGRSAWAWWAVCIVGGLVLGLDGAAVVQPDPKCRGSSSRSGSCTPVPRIPTIPHFPTIVFPTPPPVFTPPVFSPPVIRPSFPGGP